MKEVDNRNVYEVLNSFVRWNHAQQIRGRTIRNYICSVKKFILYEDVETDENRFRNKVFMPRFTSNANKCRACEFRRICLSSLAREQGFTAFHGRTHKRELWTPHLGLALVDHLLEALSQPEVQN